MQTIQVQRKVNHRKVCSDLPISMEDMCGLKNLKIEVNIFLTQFAQW